MFRPQPVQQRKGVRSFLPVQEIQKNLLRLRGLAEPKVVVRMWIIAGIATFIALLALKLR